jgi:hypothetical protein
MNIMNLLQGLLLLAPHYTTQSETYAICEVNRLDLPPTDTPLMEPIVQAMLDAGWHQQSGGEYDPAQGWSAGQDGPEYQP